MSVSRESPRSVHVMKFTAAPGAVMYVSVAFNGGGLQMANSYWEALRRLMEPYGAQYGSFSRQGPRGRMDWFIAFSAPWPEGLMDELLKKTATQLGALLYLEPATSLAKASLDMRAYTFRVNPHRRRPNN